MGARQTHFFTQENMSPPISSTREKHNFPETHKKDDTLSKITHFNHVICYENKEERSRFMQQTT